MSGYKDLMESIGNVIEKARVVCATNNLIQLGVARNQLQSAINELDSIEKKREPLNFVIADNYDQYYGWIKRNGFHPDRYRYLRDDRYLMGTRNPNVYLLGDYTNNPVYHSRNLQMAQANLRLVSEK